MAKITQFFLLEYLSKSNNSEKLTKNISLTMTLSLMVPKVEASDDLKEDMNVKS